MGSWVDHSRLKYPLLPCHEKGSCEDEAPRQGQVSQIDKEGDVFGEHCRGDVGEVLDTGGMLAS